MTSIVNRTADFVQPKVYLTRESGVYLMLVHNDSDAPIYDRNGDGVLLVKPFGYMLKSGKFEGGLAARMMQNFVHFHCRFPGGREEGSIFPSVLKLLLVHEMPGASIRGVRQVEAELNRAVRNLLAESDLHDPEQTWHSESRRIVGTPPSPEQLAEFFQQIVSRPAPETRPGPTRAL